MLFQKKGGWGAHQSKPSQGQSWNGSLTRALRLVKLSEEKRRWTKKGVGKRKWTDQKGARERERKKGKGDREEKYGD